MDEVQAEFGECAKILRRINNQRSDLHIELSRRTDVECVQVLGRVEPLDNNYEWRLAVNSLIAHHLARYHATLPCLIRQNQRVDHILNKMSIARPAMSWRVREIDSLLAELSSYGLIVTAKDMSTHLWNKMLDKLRDRYEEPMV